MYLQIIPNWVIIVQRRKAVRVIIAMLRFVQQVTLVPMAVSAFVKNVRHCQHVCKGLVQRRCATLAINMYQLNLYESYLIRLEVTQMARVPVVITNDAVYEMGISDDRSSNTAARNGKGTSSHVQRVRKQCSTSPTLQQRGAVSSPPINCKGRFPLLYAVKRIVLEDRYFKRYKQYLRRESTSTVPLSESQRPPALPFRVWLTTEEQDEIMQQCLTIQALLMDDDYSEICRRFSVLKNQPFCLLNIFRRAWRRRCTYSIMEELRYFKATEIGDIALKFVNKTC
jgi:hypothetical protein